MKRILAALTLAALATLTGCGAAPKPPVVTILQPASGAQQAQITIDAGLSALTLGATSDALVSGQVHVHLGETVDPSSKFRGDTAVVVIRQQGSKFTPNPADPATGTWDLSLSDQLPTKLDITGNAGPLKLDLSRLQLTDLAISTDLADSDITLPRQGRFAARIKANTGDKVLHIPRALAARITVKRPVGVDPIQVDGYFQPQGNVYTSPDFETAPNRMELELNAGVAKVRVVSEP